MNALFRRGAVVSIAAALLGSPVAPFFAGEALENAAPPLASGAPEPAPPAASALPAAPASPRLERSGSDDEASGGRAGMMARLTGCRVSFTAASALPDGRQELTGYVDLDCGAFRLQADRITGSKDGDLLTAEGNVSLEWEGNRLAGSRMEYHVDSGTGVIEDAVGSFPPDALVEAKRIEKISEKSLLIEDARFTSCTRPVPDWSFHVRSGRIDLGRYAHLHGVALRAGKAPVLYLPYLLWPVKGDRATGFLLGTYGSSSRLGWSLGDAFFWEIAPNADLTASATYYSRAGVEGGLEFRWLPEARSALSLETWWIDDRIENDLRYYGALRYQARPAPRWRISADLRGVSDFAWYSDFPRRDAVSSTPATISNFNLSRHGDTDTYTLRARRREQYFVGDLDGEQILTADLLTEMRPELEWRGRSRRIASTPLTFSVVASADALHRREREYDAAGPVTGGVTGREDHAYARADAQVRLAAPLSPTPWLDVETAVSLEETYYTESLDPACVAEEQNLPTGRDCHGEQNLSREIGRVSLEITGPKFSRVFEPAPGSGRPRIKHAIEPTFLYEYSPNVDESPFVPQFDEIDLAAGDFSRITYGVRQRLFVRRAIAPPPPAERPHEGAGGPPWGPASLLPPETPPPAPAAPERGGDNPVELASFDILHTWSLDDDKPLLTDTSADGTVNLPYGPVRLVARVNPSLNFSFDARGDFDPRRREFTSESVSFGARHPSAGFANLTWSRFSSGSASPAESTLGLSGGAELFDHRLHLALAGAWDGRESRLVSSGARVGYYTQCCGFLVEYARRDFIADERREWRFSIDLKGIGNLLDLNQGSGR